MDEKRKEELTEYFWSQYYERELTKMGLSPETTHKLYLAVTCGSICTVKELLIDSPDEYQTIFIKAAASSLIQQTKHSH